MKTATMLLEEADRYATTITPLVSRMHHDQCESLGEPVARVALTQVIARAFADGAASARDQVVLK